LFRHLFTPRKFGRRQAPGDLMEKE
jgi:hypothetical protein